MSTRVSKSVTPLSPRDDAGKPFVLPSVRAAEKALFEKNLNHEYAAIGGDAEFGKLSANLALGDGKNEKMAGRTSGTQGSKKPAGIPVVYFQHHIQCLAVQLFFFWAEKNAQFVGVNYSSLLLITYFKFGS